MSFPTKEIKWKKKSSTVVSQIYDTGLEYCWISAEDKQCSRFIFCKDFLHDCVWATVNQQKISIYDFDYAPGGENDVDLQTTRIALANSSDRKFDTKIESMLKFINYFATHLKLRESTAYKCDNPPARFKTGVYVVEGSSVWMNAPPLLSLYSLLIRVGFVHNITRTPQETIRGVADAAIDAYGEEDSDQVHAALPGINRLLSAGYRKYFYTDLKKNYPEDAKENIHDEGGIVSFTKHRTKTLVPGWHYKSKWDIKIEEIV